MLLYLLCRSKCGRRRVSVTGLSLITEGIVEEISRHAQKLVDRWGEENAPPPAHIYSLESHEGGGLHVVQKTFQGDFEVPFQIR